MAATGTQTPAGYRSLTLVAWIFQGLIIVTGAAVRLTEAGLGCEDWPTCNDDELLPEWEIHGLIEFGNRVLSGFVAISAVAVLIGARRLAASDRQASSDGQTSADQRGRPDVLRYAWALVAGTVAQVVLGGITVLADLHPIIVSVHFLLSIVLLWNAQLLWLSAKRSHPDQPLRSVADRTITGLAAAQLALAGAVLLTGTIVTGTGPNSGDARADRLNFDLTTVARIHSTSVWLMVAAVVVLSIRLSRANASEADGGQLTAAFGTTRWLLAAILAQGAIGYTQFTLGVPAALVEAHIIGSIVVWSVSSRLFLRLRRWEIPAEDRSPPELSAAPS